MGGTLNIAKKIEEISQNIIAELHDPNVNIIEVGISDEGRKTTSTQQVTLLENHPIKTTVTKDSVFLVSGGARGVTASCVVEMAKTFQCKLEKSLRENVGRIR